MKKQQIEKLDLEKYIGFIDEPKEYKAPQEYLLKMIQDKINELIELIKLLKKGEI
uniref:Uncharacterized protein n=1 Tax=viral metagenome TaxID=1070528 RepID=A0A6H1ZFF3_9ZZZZ